MIRVCSIFSQLLQLFPRVEFEAAVRRHRADRHSRGFSCWTQFVAMLFAHLGHAQSLREICWGLGATEGKLKHLGLQEAPRRSTLAYANQHRPWQLYQTVFEQLLERCVQTARAEKKRFRFHNPLLSIDSTVIDLCLSAFDWATYQRDKGAAKLHLVLDNRGLLPKYAVLTEGKGSDLTVAKGMNFAPRTILVFDRGYQDYRWFEQLSQQGVFFVTRLRRHAHVQVRQELPVKAPHIVRDQQVRIGSQKYRMAGDLRLVEAVDPETGKNIILITNHFRLAARTIAQIYRDRWEIEVFFRTLKQNLSIKTFVGTSANAVQIQIWTALIAVLLLRYVQMRSRFPYSLSNLVALLRQQLFVYRDVWEWLQAPLEPPPGLPADGLEQLSLGLS